jgi:cytochrome c oxidase subunit 2
MMQAFSVFSGGVAAATALLAQGGSFWLPPARSDFAPGVDDLFYLILGVSAFFFALIVTLMVWFVIRYRVRPEGIAQPSPNHNTPLEVLWTVIPVLIVMVIFYQGFTIYLDMRVAPRNAYDIRVRAQKWKWLFQYANGATDENLHVPVDQPVRLTMSSQDVIHSLFIPDFRLKQDVVPGRYNTAWFRAVAPGTYNLLCAEYCGTGHSDMLAKVIVHPPGEFEAWLQQAGNFLKGKTPAQAGRLLYEMRGCKECHSLDGTAGKGPSFRGIYGETHRFTDGTSARVDDNYIRESILEPQAKIREGFQGIMPTFKGIVSDEEITAIIEFIKTLKK